MWLGKNSVPCFSCRDCFDSAVGMKVTSSREYVVQLRSKFARYMDLEGLVKAIIISIANLWDRFCKESLSMGPMDPI